MSHIAVFASCVSQIMATKTSEYEALALWKGTAGPWLLKSSTQLANLKKLSEKMVTDALHLGYSIPVQVTRYSAQLDQWEGKLAASQGPPHGFYDNTVLTDSEHRCWWLNVLALLRLRAIKNNDMNGLSISGASSYALNVG